MTKQVNKMMQKLKLINNIFFFLLLFIFACKQSVVPEKNQIIAINKPIKNNTHLVDSSKKYLQNGCVVLRRGNDVISGMFAQFNRIDQSYSHCGIAFLENQQWVVYHSIGGEDNPDEKLRRDSYEKFVSSEHNLGFGICNLGIMSSEQVNLKKTVQTFYQDQIPFDMKFDLKSNDRLYCAEMIYKAYHIALQTDTFFKTTHNGPFVFVSTDNIFMNNHSQILCRITY